MHRRIRFAIVLIAGGAVLACTFWTVGSVINSNAAGGGSRAVLARSSASGPPMYTLPPSPALPHGPQMLRMLAGVGNGTGSSWKGGNGDGSSVTLDSMTSPAQGAAEGIDVADYQHANGPINWPQVASAGYSFVYIKATEGTYYKNPDYAGDFAGSRAAGMRAGAYAFATPDTASGTQEADYLLNTINYSNDGLTLPPMVDLEWDPYNSSEPCYGLSTSAMVSWIGSFVGEVLARTSRYALIYTAASWWQQCTGGTSAFAADPLSIAAYGVAAPPLPSGWSNYVIWQYSSTGSVPGISTQTDQDQFNGPLSSLEEFATNGQGTAQEIPSPVGQSDGVVDVFWRGSGALLDHMWYVPGGGWYGPQAQSSQLASDPTSVSTGGGGLQVLYQGANADLWGLMYNGAGIWYGPGDLGMGPLGGAPRAVSAQHSVDDVFWRGTNNGLWHAWTFGGAWYGPQELAPAGSVASDPAPVALGVNGAMDVFWRGANATLWDVQYRAGVWSSPRDLNMGTLGSQPEGVNYAPGDVEAAWAGTDQNIWTALQTSGIQGPRPGGDGPLVSYPELASAASGTADIFWTGSTGTAWYASQSGGGSWSGPAALPSGPVGSQPVPAASSLRVFDVFWRGTNGGLWHAWTFGGAWYGPQSLAPGGSFG